MPKGKKRKVFCDCGSLVTPGSVFCSECKKQIMVKNKKVLDGSSPIPDLFTLVRRA